MIFDAMDIKGTAKPGRGLPNYIRVKERKVRFRNDFPLGVIIPEMVSDLKDAMDYAIFRAGIWKEREDYLAGKKPDSVGWSLSVARGPKADATSWVENCEESATGRALDNLGYYGDKELAEGVENLKCSEEEIEQARGNDETLKSQEQRLVDKVLRCVERVKVLDEKLDPWEKYFSFVSEGQQYVLNEKALRAKIKKGISLRRKNFLNSALQKIALDYPGIQEIIDDTGEELF